MDIIEWTTLEPEENTNPFYDNFMNFTEHGDTNDTFVSSFCGREYANFLATYIPNSALYVLQMLLCSMGVVGNLANILIFTRSGMRGPTNTILTGLSVADLIRSLMFIPDFVAQTEFFVENYPYFQAVSYIIYWNTIALFHPISVLMTLALGIWRYIAVLYPLKSRSLCTMRRAQIIVASIFLVNLVLCFPNFFALTINVNHRHVQNNNNKATTDVDEDSARAYMGFCNPQYCAERSEFSRSHDYIRKFNLVLHGLVVRIIPCAILTFVTIRLFHSLRQSVKTRNLLATHRPSCAPPPSTVLQMTAAIVEAADNAQKADKERRKSSVGVGVLRGVNNVKLVDIMKLTENSEKLVTKMLIAILLVFLLTEAPVGIMIIAFLLLPFELVLECTKHLGVLSVIIIQLSGSVNFVVYFVMSQNFRRTLHQILSHMWSTIRLKSGPNSANDSLYRK